MNSFPLHFEPYTDVYFLRSLEILQKEGINPFVRVQFFIRKGPGKIGGIRESISLLQTYSPLEKNGGRILVLEEESDYFSNETIILIEARAQDIIPFETMMLGIISEETTRINEPFTVDTQNVTQKIRDIVGLAGDRSVLYFGARHFRYDHDEIIAKAAFEGGAREASTDIGALTQGRKGVGTIPHSLECVYAWKYGVHRAVVESLKAFDRCIDVTIPRVALVDFANKEIDDTLLCFEECTGTISGIRIDTCGENVMQGASPIAGHEDDPFWYGNGVTISGVSAVRKQLNEHGYLHAKIILSSGFGDTKKMNAFIQAEHELGLRLFDMVGIGEVLPIRAATMDIVGVGETIDAIQPISKVGRRYNKNSRLVPFSSS